MDEIKKKKKKSKKDDIKWHPAFVVAIQAILINYRDVLDYKVEHPLTIDPLRIDILVIKKRPEIVIEKQIAEIFRLENIFEYKSPTDPLSVDEFHKALARTHLYKALTKGVEITDLTLSLVVTAYHENLFPHLRDTLGYTVEEKHSGIHVVTGAVVPIQLIEVGLLSKDENHWLKNLTRKLSEPEQDIKWLKRLRREYDPVLDIGAYLHVIVKANQQRLKKEGNDMLTAEICKTFEELGWTEKWMESGELKGKLEDACAMFAEGDSIEKIARITKLPLDTLKENLAVQ
jgi:hypothetical protein